MEKITIKVICNFAFPDKYFYFYAMNVCNAIKIAVC